MDVTSLSAVMRGKDGEVGMTPLEKALQRQNAKSCLTCKDRVEIGGIFYCQIDGKMIHPLLLNKQYYTRCPTDEQRGDGEVGMTVERMVELLEIEKECVLQNASGECNRYCAGCDLLQDDTELHEMYTGAIALLQAQEPKGKAYWIQRAGRGHNWNCSNCGEKISYNEEQKNRQKRVLPVWLVNRYCRGCGREMTYPPADE